jgi:hypothetical protein
MKVVRSALCTGHLYPPGIIPGTHFCSPGYGLDGPWIESWWRARFFAHVQTGPGAHPACCTMGTGSFPGVKRPGQCAVYSGAQSIWDNMVNNIKIMYGNKKVYVKKKRLDTI